MIKEFEGCELKAYDDGVGVWTIGYGATFYQNGAPVKAGDTITQQEADELLAFHLKKFWDGLSSTPHWSMRTNWQRAALLSFSFNTGWQYGAEGFDTLNATVSEGRWYAIPSALRLYVNPGTLTEAGLKRRREAEIKLWLT